MTSPDVSEPGTDRRTEKRRLRLWVLLALIPILGIGLAFLLPPMDEYAVFDGVGKREAVDVAAPAATPLGWRASTNRGWQLNLSEVGARDFIDRFTTKARGWQKAGFGRGASSQEIPETGMMETVTTETASFVNGETGDRLHFTLEKEETPKKQLRSAVVVVDQTTASRRPWAKLKRWAHLNLSR